MLRKKRKKNKTVGEKCRFLYVDSFGHPYCTASAEKALECESCLPSEEYQIMKAQIEFQDSLRDGPSHFKVPSTYRCTKFDEFADEDGHLPPDMRAKPPDGLFSITGKF